MPRLLPILSDLILSVLLLQHPGANQTGTRESTTITKLGHHGSGGPGGASGGRPSGAGGHGNHSSGGGGGGTVQLDSNGQSSYLQPSSIINNGIIQCSLPVFENHGIR